MTAVIVKAAVAGVLALALVRAFMGPPPARLHPVLTLTCGFAGVVGYPIAALVAVGGAATSASVLIGVSVCLIAVAAWAARGPGDDGGEPRDDGPVPPLDWEAFDRERARWSSTARR